jgi:hypothetical protein
MPVPLISIVLPTYNGSRYLAESVESCLAQSMEDWELIIVDDGSTDSTPEIIAQFTARDNRIRGIRNPANRKTPGSLNIGFEKAQGSLFTWTSDDNLFRPTALEEMAGCLQTHSDIEFVYAGMTMIDENGRRLSYVPAQSADRLLASNVVNACFMYRRQVHEALGGYAEDMFLVEDYDFWLRASAQFRLMALDKDLYLYRWHAQALTMKRRGDAALAHERVVEKHLPAMVWATREQKAEAYWELSHRAEVRGDFAAQRKYVSCIRELTPASGRSSPRLCFSQAQHLGWLALKNGQVRVARKYALHSAMRRPWSGMAWRLGYCALRGR